MWYCKFDEHFGGSHGGSSCRQGSWSSGGRTYSGAALVPHQPLMRLVLPPDALARDVALALGLSPEASLVLRVQEVEAGTGCSAGREVKGDAGGGKGTNSGCGRGGDSSWLRGSWVGGSGKASRLQGGVCSELLVAPPSTPVSELVELSGSCGSRERPWVVVTTGASL